MVEIGNRPFLEYELVHLREFGINNIILAVSHRRESIEERFADGRSLGISIAYSRESQPLGTAGALRKALPLIRGNDVLVLNGDSFVDVDYVELLRLHRARAASLTITAAFRSDCRDYGRLKISDGRVLSFHEKEHSDPSPGYVNAGVYVFRRELIQGIQPDIVQSLENNVFSSLLAQGELIFAYSTSGYFLDMGTPQRLEQLRADFMQGLVPLRGVN